VWASNKEHEEREGFKKSFLFVASTLIKKKIKFSSYIRTVAKSYMRKGFLYNI
jgi:hypothetical protein